jgi:NAD(P)-dependent dehydrogenase (short-subunit alcohol dehydrogenase family)
MDAEAGEFAGKVALLTGAAGAIGAATAAALAAKGAQICAVDRAGANWTALRAALPASAHLETIEADVRTETETRRYVERAQSVFGRIDVFFNNAGVEGVVQPVDAYPLETFKDVMSVNVEGVFLGMKYVLPIMYAQGAGSIINTSSTAGLRGGPGMIAYVASKHAVLGMTRCAAAEAAPRNVRVNCVNPGPIEGRMMDSITAGVGDQSAARKHFEAAVPARRFGKPEEVAAVVAFLASDAAVYCNGAFFAVDGAFTAT